MKKIPTLFIRDENWKATREVRPGFEWVLAGEGVATVKYDGSCTMVKDGKLYKRYDAKRGKKPPEGAIPCQEPDPVTDHWPHWVEVDQKKPEDKWFMEAYLNENFLCARIRGENLPDGTYEACGPHFQGNPHGMKYDALVPHGKSVVICGRSFDGIRDYLRIAPIEGLVFWKDGEPQCKIKRSDFGFEWTVR